MRNRRVAKNKENKDVNVIPEGGNGLIYVGFPRERFLIPEFVDCRDRILSEIQKNGRACGYFNANGHRVDKNRDSIVRAFMTSEQKPEWLLQLDTDMEHPYDIAETLVAHKKPIVGGLYFHRGDEHDPFIFNRVADMKDAYGRVTPHWSPMRAFIYDYLEQCRLPQADGSFHVKNPPINPLVECDAIATGALLIHRSVFENLPQPYFEYRDYAISEDLMFCKIAKDNGYRIFCDISVISGHYRNIPVGQAEFRAVYENMSVETTKFTREHATSDLSRYLSLSIEEAAKVIEDGSANITSSYWEEVQPSDDKAIKKFYKSDEVGKLYIVELMYWNMNEAFTRFRSNLRKIRRSRILEIGSGIGTIACQMAMQMNDISFYEINPIVRGFAKMRIEDMVATPGIECTKPVSIERDDWWNEVIDGSLDYVMAFDVFEHIPESELRMILPKIFLKLRPGGRLLYHNNFKQQDIYPHHIDHEDKWSSMLEEAGLIEISSFEALKKM